MCSSAFSKLQVAMNKATVERYMSERLVTVNVKSTARDIAKVMDQSNVS